MVKLLSILNRNPLIDTESIPKSTLQLLFLCSIVGNAVFARKDDKTYESKSYPSPTYHPNEEVETGFESDNRNIRDNNQPGSNWNRMKGIYGHRNSDAFRMMDYLGRNYGFASNGKTSEPRISSSSPADAFVSRGKENSQEAKGQSNSKAQIKDLLKNHRLEQEMLEQKPERLTQINDEDDGEEDGENVEVTLTTTSTTTSPTTSIESTSVPPSPSTTAKIISTSTTITTAAQTTATPATPLLSKLSSKSSSNNHEAEGAQSPSASSASASSPSTSPIQSPSPVKASIQSPGLSASPETESSEATKQSKHVNSLRNKLSVHQLLSESMPTLQMSVSPIYFYNKATKSLVAIPYLVMKSISKMPLLPSMMDGGPSNLINYVHSPFNHKSRSRSINQLSPFLEALESRESIPTTDLSYSSHNDDSSTRWITVTGSGSDRSYQGLVR